MHQLTTIKTRATEFTTPESMPAVLPPTSAYTYCADITVDGAGRVRFDKPVTIWVENFLGFDVGVIVPVGYYDRDQGFWVPSDNGDVVELLDDDGDGVVDSLDADGDGLPNDLDDDGSYTDEVTGLDNPETYSPGATYWRATVSHFTPFDCNWPYGDPEDAVSPNTEGKASIDADDDICFVKGTLIATDHGLNFIENMKPGDHVWSKAGFELEPVLKEITGTSVRRNQPVLYLTFIDADGMQETIGMTQDHPLWKKDQGWTPAGKLKPGDRVYAREGRWLKLTDVVRAPDLQTVYNFEVKGTHTYFVGKGSLWAHNSCTGSVNIKKQVLHQDIRIPGTDISLHYSGNRVEGYKYKLSVPASGSSVPDSLKHIIVKVNFLGRTFEKKLGPEPNQIAEFAWDGLDYLGRQHNSAIATIKIGFVYDEVYYEPFRSSTSAGLGGGGISSSFAQFGSKPTNIMTRRESILWKRDSILIEMGKKGKGTIAEGWTLSNHHFQKPGERSLYKGDGTILQNNADMINTVAEIADPKGITFDAAGNIYVAGDNIIHKISSSGSISVVAGIENNEDYSGDGGPATEAAIGKPSDVAVDAFGNVFIADDYNNCIRKVDINGIITTVAGIGGDEGYSGDGGPADQALLFRPEGIAVDGSGNLYIADTLNFCVRKVDINGIITTIAGGQGYCGFSGDGGAATEAELADITGIDVDHSGNIYIADSYYNVIRKIDASGIITTIAGVPSLSKHCDPSYDGDQANEGWDATEAYICFVEDVAVDDNGNVYIGSMSRRIRKVDTNGKLFTIAGIGIGDCTEEEGIATSTCIDGVFGIAVDPSGDLFFSELWRDRVCRIGPSPASINLISKNEILHPEESGIGHILSDAGYHLQTIDLDTGAMLREFKYNQDNQLTSVNDPFSNAVTIERDLDGVPTAIISPDGLTTLLSIDEHNHLTDVTYPDGSLYSFEYNADSLMTRRVEPELNRYDYDYDVDGRLISVMDQEGGDWQYSKTVYESGAMLIKETSGEHTTTSFLDHEDSTGNYTSIKTDPTGARIEFERSFDKNTLDVARPCGLNRTFAYAFDPVYSYKYINEVTITSPSGLAMTSSRTKNYKDTDSDEKNDLITETVTVNDTTTILENNLLASQKTITSPEGRTLSVTYNPDNLLTEQIDQPGRHPLTFEHDIRGRLTSMAASDRSVEFAYTNKGFLGSLTDSENHTFNYSYDEAGRLQQVDRPDSTSLSFSYDKNGNMTVLTNPSGTNHTFEYNKVNLSTLYQTPLTGAYSFQYNKDHNLVKKTFPSGDSIDLTYANTLLTRIQAPEGTIDYSYDCGSRPASVSRGSESISYTHDGTLLLSEAFSGTLNQDLSYSYNNDFRITRVDYAGEVTDYAYDKDGLMTTSGNFTITRNAENGLAESVTGGTFAAARTFNGFAEIDSLDISINDVSLTTWNLTRDGNGSITQKTETIGGESSTYKYVYDAMGRLLTVKEDGILVEEYRYDPNGTRSYEMNSHRGITGRQFTYSDEDHLLTAGSASYQYDYNGFLATKTSGSDVTRYNYVSTGELLGVTLPEGTKISYVYDPLGRRIARKVDGLVTGKFLWQGLTRLLAVYDENDALIMRFEYADSRLPVAVTGMGDTYYLTWDQVGSLRIVADASGNVLKKIDYDAFGNIISDSAPALSIPFGFAGGLYDPDTGLVRFGYRDYDPDIGRWTAKDPILFAGGDTDLYGYVLNDPVNLVDPSGQFVIGGIVVGAVAGAYGGFVGGMIDGNISTGLVSGIFGGIAGGAVGSIAPGLSQLAGGIVGGITGGAIGGIAGVLFGQGNGTFADYANAAVLGGMAGGMTGIMGGLFSAGANMLGATGLMVDIAAAMSTSPFGIGLGLGVSAITNTCSE